MDIGKLERTEIRNVWPVEPGLTKWLEMNPDVLSDALGVQLTSLTREQSTGDFYVDLVGQDESGSTVVVENQFGRSDHDHLGKLLTYLSAFDAKTGVWIVENPRSEHVKAVAWLNDSSSVASFFLLKIEAVKIGDSLPAPMLTLIVGPSEESKSVSAKKQELAVIDSARKRFWTGLIQRLKDQRVPLHSNLSPSAGGWISTGAGKSGLTLGYILRNKDAQVELYIDLGKRYDARNVAMFEHFHAHKGEIEDAFGEPIEWQTLDGRQACRIAKQIDGGGLKDEDKWDRTQDAMIAAFARP